MASTNSGCCKSYVLYRCLQWDFLAVPPSVQPYSAILNFKCVHVCYWFWSMKQKCKNFNKNWIPGFNIYRTLSWAILCMYNWDIFSFFGSWRAWIFIYIYIFIFIFLLYYFFSTSHCSLLASIKLLLKARC
jgi:hypothetical protein